MQRHQQKLQGVQPQRQKPVLIVMCFLSLGLAGCTTSGGVTSTTTTTRQIVVGAATTTVGEPTPASTDELEVREVYERVSPAVALVSTPMGITTGVLVKDQVLTSARTVWPFGHASLMLANGTEIEEAPVAALDHVAGVAVLDVGRVQDLPTAVTVGSTEDLSLGAVMYFVGYSVRDQEEFNPAVAMGFLSETRAWDTAGLAYLHVQRTVGVDLIQGVLASASGDVVGLVMDGPYGFEGVVSLADVLERLEDGRINNGSVEVWSTDMSSTETTVTEATVTISDEAPGPTWLLRAPVGTSGLISAESEGDVTVTVIGPDGDWVAFVDDSAEGLEFVTLDVEKEGPYFVSLGSFEGAPIEAHMMSDFPLVLLGAGETPFAVEPGTIVEGDIDYFGDVDLFSLDLEAGDELSVTVESGNVDPYVCLSLADSPGVRITCDDDSFGGFSGLDAQVSFIAVESDSYVIRVSGRDAMGGYVISIDVSA